MTNQYQSTLSYKTNNVTAPWPSVLFSNQNT